MSDREDRDLKWKPYARVVFKKQKSRNCESYIDHETISIMKSALRMRIN